MDSWWSVAAVTPDERKNFVDTWMDIVGKTLVIGQLLPRGGATGAVCQDVTTQRCHIQSHYWEQSWLSKAGSPRPPTSSSCLDPLPQDQDHPPPLIYYQLHYLFLISSLTSVRLHHSSTWCRMFLFVFFLLLKPFKRFYLQEHSWMSHSPDENLKCRSFCPS